MSDLGELLAEAKADGRMATGGEQYHSTPASTEGVLPTLEQLGITYKVSAVAQQLAALPEDAP